MADARPATDDREIIGHCWRPDRLLRINRVPSVPCQIHPTNSFYEDVRILCEQLGGAADRVLIQISDAVDALYKAPADPPVQPLVWWRGSTFTYPIGEEFLLVFTRTTDRDPSTSRPTLIHLYLKNVMRR